MRPTILWLKVTFAVLCGATLVGAQNLPQGTALPVMLSTRLNAKDAKPGQKIEGKLMQEVLQPATGEMIKSGSRVTGHVVSVIKPGDSGSRIVLQFDQLQDEHGVIPLNVRVRALAASASVFQAGVPVDNNTDAEPPTQWATKQVGGDIVFRGRGYVASDQGKVGTWSGNGVWGKLAPGGDCSESDDNGTRQSLWIFSTTACGVYGFRDLKLSQSGGSAPLGQVTLQAAKDIDIRGGSGWLLLANAPPAKAATK